MAVLQYYRRLSHRAWEDTWRVLGPHVKFEIPFGTIVSLLALSVAGYWKGGMQGGLIGAGIPLAALLLIVAGTFLYQRFVAPARIDEEVVRLRDEVRNELSSIRFTREKFDGVAELRSEGINELLNKPPTSDNELQEWRHRNDEWEGRVREFLTTHFTKSDALIFQDIGSVDDVRWFREGAYNDEHARHRVFLNNRIGMLNGILDHRHDYD